MHSRYMKKKLSVTNYQGNANQNHNEVSPHICQDGYHYKKKKKTDNKCWQVCGEMGKPAHY